MNSSIILTHLGAFLLLHTLLTFEYIKLMQKVALYGFKLLMGINYCQFSGK